MAAGLWAATIQRGATWDPSLTVKDDAGNPLDLDTLYGTGHTFRLEFRPSQDSDTVLLALTSGGGEITETVASGVIKPEIDAAASAGIRWKRAWMALTVTFGTGGSKSSGEVERIIEGEVRVSR